MLHSTYNVANGTQHLLCVICYTPPTMQHAEQHAQWLMHVLQGPWHHDTNNNDEGKRELRSRLIGEN